MSQKLKQIFTVSFFILIINIIFSLPVSEHFRVEGVIGEIAIYLVIYLLYLLVKSEQKKAIMRKQDPNFHQVPYGIKLKYGILFCLVGIVIGLISAIPLAGAGIFVSFLFLDTPVLSQIVFIIFLSLPYILPIVAFFLGYSYGNKKGLLRFNKDSTSISQNSL